ncbi:hypothetical protein GPJ56_007229 [Histomonas meleagridis]|nr:hypothetical protein GPJ56_007229 [Histomonas meleagridis]
MPRATTWSATPGCHHAAVPPPGPPPPGLHLPRAPHWCSPPLILAAGSHLLGHSPPGLHHHWVSHLGATTTCVSPPLESSCHRFCTMPGLCLSLTATWLAACHSHLECRTRPQSPAPACSTTACTEVLPGLCLGHHCLDLPTWRSPPLGATPAA